MKKKFEEPVLEIIQFSAEEIMTASTALLNDNLGIVDWKNYSESEQ